VSRHYERAYHDHYALPYYWLGGDLWAGHPDPAGVVYPVPQPPSQESETETGQPTHLRSAHEVEGYRIDAADQEFGAVDDFLMDDTSWRIAFLVVSTRKWLPGRKVLVTPERIESVDWIARTVRVEMTAESIKQAPSFDPDLPLNSQLEQVMYDFKGRPKGHSGG
jgi:hypothetical protein